MREKLVAYNNYYFEYYCQGGVFELTKINENHENFVCFKLQMAGSQPLFGTERARYKTVAKTCFLSIAHEKTTFWAFEID